MNVVLLISALLASSLGLALKGCSPGNRPGKAQVEGDAPVAQAVAPPASGLATVSGRFTFEDVAATANADGTVGPTVTRVRPVRFAQVVNLDASVTAPRTLSAAPVFTDVDGNFALPSPVGTAFRPTLVMSTVGSGHGGVEVRTTAGVLYAVSLVDPATGQAFVLPAGTTSAAITPDPLTAAGVQRLGGVANILDAGLTGVDSVRATLGTTLPTAVFLYDATATAGSFFEARNAAVNGPAITVKGGAAATDDTDEYDDDVILHELGHHVALALSKDSSLGGDHVLSDAANPPLAFSEGFATFFSALVRGDPVFIDAAGVLGNAPTGFVINVESRALSTPSLRGGARGLRSEQSVAEILWDLVDGAEGRPNADAESVVLTAAQVLGAVTALKGTRAYVSLNDVLDNLVISGLISAASLNALLGAPENQNLRFPPDAADVFPTRVVPTAVGVPDVVVTRGVRGPGTSTQDEVSRFYVLDLAAAGTLTASLALGNGVDGRNASGTNVDLAVLTDANVNALDTGGAAIAPLDRTVELNPERIPAAGASPRLAAGRYILYVHGRNDLPGGARNASNQRVPYVLTVGP